MEVYDAVRTRLTVRSFKPDPVPDDVVNKLLEAARLAPSSSNLQPWHFIVIRDRDTLRKIGRIASWGSWTADAPMGVAIAMGDTDRPELDAGRALQQMELVAWSEGLGTCFVDLRIEEENRAVKELLRIPEHMALITVLPFGYRHDNVTGRGGKRDRKSLSEIAHSEQFGASYTNG